MTLVIFDYDGVLADTLDDLLQFGQRACHQLGVDHVVTKEDLSKLEVMSFASYGRACEVPEHLINDFVGISLKFFEEKDAPPAIFSGMTEVIQSLAKDHKIAIVTTNSSKNVHAFLASHGLNNSVHIIYGVDTPGSKAQKISMARERFTKPGEAVFMVGDAISDIRAAKEAKVTSVAVTWGHQGLENLLRGEPDFVIHSPKDLTEIIERITG